MGVRYGGDVLHDDFRGLGLSSPGLARNHDARVLVLLPQHSIGGVSHRVNVRRVLEELSAFVFCDEVVAVDVHGTIGVHRDGHLPDVSVNFSCLVSAIGSKEMKSLTTLMSIKLPRTFIS